MKMAWCNRCSQSRKARSRKVDAWSRAESSKTSGEEEKQAEAAKEKRIEKGGMDGTTNGAKDKGTKR